MTDKTNPKLGQIVRILRGRDAGSFAVVIGIIHDRAVWIADGKKRRFDSPKKKNILHLEEMPYFATDVVRELEESGRVSNKRIRIALEKFAEYYQSDGLSESQHFIEEEISEDGQR